MASRQQRRAAERAGKVAARPVWKHPGVLVVAAVVVAGAGWLAWSRATERPLVRDGAPSWSPDSKQIAFYSERDGKPADLFLMNADGTGERRLTSTPAAEGYPSWSHDGKQMAFVAGDDLWVMDTLLKEPVRVTHDAARERDLAFSPDGRRLYYTTESKGEVDLQAVDCPREDGAWFLSRDFHPRALTHDAAVL